MPCAGLHNFYRQRDLVFLIVQYEDMSINEQMQHRIGNLPAFRIFSQASPLYMAPHQSHMHQDATDTMQLRWCNSDPMYCPTLCLLCFRGGGMWLTDSRASVIWCTP